MTMPRVTTTTTLTLAGQLTLEDLGMVAQQFTEAGVAPDAVVSIRTVSPDRPGEMTETTFTATRVDPPYGTKAV